MSRATKALAALAALAASASAAHPAPAAVNCSRHIRVGVFDDANPFAGAFLALTSRTSGIVARFARNRLASTSTSPTRSASGLFPSADTQRYKLEEGQELQATLRLAHAFRWTVPRIVSRVDALLRGSERPAPRGVLPGVGREPGCVTACIYLYQYVQLGP